MVFDTILLATVLVSLVSLVGIAVLYVRENLLRVALFFIVSFATGTLFGGAFFHLLPEVSEQLDAHDVFPVVLFGIISFFILEKIFWHHHHTSHAKDREAPMGYLNLIGDAFHNFFDGVAIAASFLASPAVGVTTTLVVILHEIPQEIGDFGLLLYSGFSKTKALAFNLLSALMAVVGAAAFYYFASVIENFEALGLAFTAGMFIYIASSDLIPELHKETNPGKSFLQLLFVLLGIGLIMVLTTVLEHPA